MWEAEEGQSLMGAYSCPAEVIYKFPISRPRSDLCISAFLEGAPPHPCNFGPYCGLFAVLKLPQKQL